MQRLQKALYMAIIASETSHVFCCVLPTIFSIISLMAGVGLVSAMPGWLESIHADLHHWELPLIAMSGVVVVLGWALYAYSRKIDCHNTGCHHGSCEPRKKTANNILKIATILFVVNTAVYLVFHRGLQVDLDHADHAISSSVTPEVPR